MHQTNLNKYVTMKFHPLLLAVLLPLCSSLSDPVVETLDEPEFCTFRADLGDTMKLHLEVEINVQK